MSKELFMFKLHKQSIFALIVGLMFAAGVAVAQNPSFEELDADGDGYISQSEAQALPCLIDAWDNMDPASDKGLNSSEFSMPVRQNCSNNQPANEWRQSNQQQVEIK